jgi:hypothetical protein
MFSCHGTKEAIWLRTLLKLIGYPQTNPTIIYCDNNGLNGLTWDPSFHAQSKHIDIQHHYVCKHVEAGDVTFLHILTQENPADALTKALPRPQFTYLTKKMGMVMADTDLST